MSTTFKNCTVINIYAFVTPGYTEETLETEPYVEIPLQQDRGVALVSEADAERMAELGPWFILHQSHTDYAQRAPYVPERRRTVNELMHRVVTGAPKGMVVHHVSGDGLDNRRSNLRVVTTTQHRRIHAMA
jgi:hypothetical protein